LGLPGLFAAKAINTADSMIGHRTPRHLWFGWAAARADDDVNWLPARLSGVLLCLAGRGGWRTMLRDARHHASPNGGWPEAAMAGALSCTLGGPVSYDREPAMRTILGQGPRPGAHDLARALRIYRVAGVLLWLIVGGIAWLA
jgi:adenosylcobinamide-phosphate synthase